MNYWLFKSEPSVFSFDDLKKKGKAGTQWDGVRNYAARNNMKAMKIGADDPYAKAGLFESVRISAWNCVFNNPANPSNP